MAERGPLAQVGEGDGPSYFNPLEAATLVHLVVGLLAAHRGTTSTAAPTAADIGVIATYRKQARPQRMCCWGAACLVGMDFPPLNSDGKWLGNPDSGVNSACIEVLAATMNRTLTPRAT